MAPSSQSLLLVITMIISGGNDQARPSRAIFEKRTCIFRPLDAMVSKILNTHKVNLKN